MTPKMGVKGPGAESWLRGRNVPIPPAVYDTCRTADGSLIARLGAGDFFLEGESAARLADELGSGAPGAYRVERHDAAFDLPAATAAAVLAQVCGVDFRNAVPGRIVLTRAAGVNCMVLLETSGETPTLRLWVDGTYAAFVEELLSGTAHYATSGG